MKKEKVTYALRQFIIRKGKKGCYFARKAVNKKCGVVVGLNLQCVDGTK